MKAVVMFLFALSKTVPVFQLLRTESFRIASFVELCVTVVHNSEEHINSNNFASYLYSQLNEIGRH